MSYLVVVFAVESTLLPLYSELIKARGKALKTSAAFQNINLAAEQTLINL